MAAGSRSRGLQHLHPHRSARQGPAGKQGYWELRRRRCCGLRLDSTLASGALPSLPRMQPASGGALRI
jgi:hypothetical protein